METWKDIKGYEGYQVSNFGRVRTFNKFSVDKHGRKRMWKDRIIKASLRKNNSYVVNLWKDGEAHTFYVHRLVAIAFLGEPSDSHLTVNHIDGNRRNNHLDNLEWLTIGDNIRHGYRTGLYENKTIRCQLTDQNGKIYTFESKAEMSRFLGFSLSYPFRRIQLKKPIMSKSGEEYKLTEIKQCK